MILELPMQSMPITTNVVSLNLTNSEVYSIQHYVINFVSDMSGIKAVRLVTHAIAPATVV
jgi:hypothetical protein